MDILQGRRKQLLRWVDKQYIYRKSKTNSYGIFYTHGWIDCAILQVHTVLNSLASVKSYLECYMGCFVITKYLFSIHLVDICVFFWKLIVIICKSFQKEMNDSDNGSTNPNCVWSWTQSTTNSLSKMQKRGYDPYWG